MGMLFEYSSMNWRCVLVNFNSSNNFYFSMRSSLAMTICGRNLRGNLLKYRSIFAIFKSYYLQSDMSMICLFVFSFLFSSLLLLIFVICVKWRQYVFYFLQFNFFFIYFILFTFHRYSWTLCYSLAI